MEEQMEEVKTKLRPLSCQASPQATPQSDLITYNPSRSGHHQTVCEAAIDEVDLDTQTNDTQSVDNECADGQTNANNQIIDKEDQECGVGLTKDNQQIDIESKSEVETKNEDLNGTISACQPMDNECGNGKPNDNSKVVSKDDADKTKTATDDKSQIVHSNCDDNSCDVIDNGKVTESVNDHNNQAVSKSCDAKACNVDEYADNATVVQGSRREFGKNDEEEDVRRTCADGKNADVCIDGGAGKGGNGSSGGTQTSNDEGADKVNTGEENRTVGACDGEQDCGVIRVGGGGDTGEEDRTGGDGDEAEDGGSCVGVPSSTPPGQRSPPNGGWGWVVALGSAVIMMLIPVMGPCFGILFSRYLLESGTSSTTIAWIFNSQCFIWNTSGLFSRPLTKEFGWRKVGVVGAFTASAGFIVSAFAPAPEFLFFSYSFLCGVGGGIVTTMCFSIVPQYFDSHRGASNGLMMAGVGVGQIGGPPFARWLQDTFSDKGATLIIGAIMLHGCVAATLFHPVEWHLKEEQEKGRTKERLLIQGDESVQKAKHLTVDSGSSHLKPHHAEEQKELNEVQPQISRTETHQAIHNNIQSSNPRTPAVLDIFIRVGRSTISDLRVLRSARASIICLAGTLCLNSNLNFIMMVPFAIQDAGESLDFAAWCLSVKAVCNLLTRLLVSPLADWSKFSVRWCYVAGFVVLAISTFVFPMIDSPPWLLATMAVYGCGVGANLGLHSLMMIELMGLDQLPAVYGASSFIIALGFICFGPLIGVVRDASDSYLISMWVLGAMLLLSILLWLFMGPAARYDKRKEQQQQQQKQASSLT